MKFAHISDSHLGGWRQPELQELNLESFRKAIDICINNRVDFIVFTGDLFDTPFPAIDILKETFSEFRRIKESGIKSYIIAGSHDYSASGKTFLDVLEKAGFLDICKFEENPVTGEIILKPITNQSCLIYGYPGKKSGLEVGALEKIKILEPYTGKFRILMLHTTIKEVSEGIPVESVSLSNLPKADYYALGHIHIEFKSELDGRPVVYGGPTFPNNFKELEELKAGSFYIVEIGGFTKVTKIDLKIKEIEFIEIEIEDSIAGTEKILQSIEKKDLFNKIVLLKVIGKLKHGKSSDIKYSEIEEYIRKKGAYSFLKSTSQLVLENDVIDANIITSDMERIEETLFRKYEQENPSAYNDLIIPLVETLNIQKQEGETEAIFSGRLIGELTKVLKIDLA